MSPAVSRPTPAVLDRDAHLRSITGLRAVAAAWVVLVHAQALTSALVSLPSWTESISTLGFLGVDLFFAISGFVIAHRYFESMSGPWRFAQVRDFLVLRVARLYPMHLTMLMATGLLVWVWGQRGDSGLSVPLSALPSQLFLTHGWFNQQLSWNEPSWTISLEWLAYLAFPFLAVAVGRLIPRLGTLTSGLLLWGLSIAPLILTASGVLRLQDFGDGGPSLGLARIWAGFLGGMGAYLVARASASRARTRAVAGWLAPVAAAAILLGSIALGAAEGPGLLAAGFAPSGQRLWLITLLFAPLVALLALCDGPRSPLASRGAVVLGLASYSLYMTHELMLRVLSSVALGGITPDLDVRSAPPVARVLAVAVCFGLLVVVALAAWHWIEEPSRRILRRTLVQSAPELPVEERLADQHPGNVPRPGARKGP